MRKILLMTVCAMWVTNGVLLAQDAKASNEQKLESVKKLRTQVLSKLPALADLFDPDHNGTSTALISCRKQFEESVVALNRQIETEANKPSDARDQLALDKAAAKVARFQALWSDFNFKYLVAFNKKWFALSQVTRPNLVNLVNDLAAQDQVWLRAECDPALLVAVLTELNNRVDDVKEQATISVAEYIKRCNDNESTYKE